MLHEDIPSTLDTVEAILTEAMLGRREHARRLEQYRSERAVIADLREHHQVHDRLTPVIGRRWV